VTVTLLPPTPEQKPFVVQGSLDEVWGAVADELMVSGPAGTGKSRAILEYLYYLSAAFPGCRGLVVRKTRASLTESALVTFETHVVPGRPAWVANQMRRVRQSYQLPNGSEIVIGGLDNTSRFMSTEFDWIYCLVGDTRVESPSPIEKAYVREYSGPLVTIRTALGNELTGTPNHPILTDQGWVALGLLSEGDYVVSRELVQDVRAGGDPDVQHQPATIAEVARALALSPSSRTERVETVGMDFHGDGSDGYVDVVSPAGSLHDRLDAARTEPLVELERGRGDFERQWLHRQGAAGATLLGMGAHDVAALSIGPELAESFSVLGRLHPPLSGGSTRGLEALHPVGVGVSDVSVPLGIARGPWGQSSAPQFGLQRGVADADGRGDRIQAALAGKVARDRVVHVSRVDRPPGGFTHVYNLQTSDNYYVANNIVSHNCQEAREIEEAEWEDLTSRLRNGVLPFQMMIGDTNPDGPTHWIVQRARLGKLRLIESRHEDNPVLFDAREGAYTPAGEIYLGRLDNLTGVRHKRLRLGLWVGAEGMVYDLYDPAVHEIDPVPIDPSWRRFCAVDFGYTNAFACLWGAEDYDGRLLIYRQVYGVQRLVRDWAHLIHDLTGDEKISLWVTDHDLEARAELEEHANHAATDCGKAKKRWVHTKPARKDVMVGIQKVSERLKRTGDGKPRLMIFKDALVEADPLLIDQREPFCLQDEFPRYTWAKARSQTAGEVTLEDPVKKWDHALDALRYLVMEIDATGQVGPALARAIGNQKPTLRERMAQKRAERERTSKRRGWS
jgi:hypothetical protein